MIVYKARGSNHFLHIFHLKGSVFPYAILLALPSALLTVLLKWLIDEGHVDSWLGEHNTTLSNNSVWSSFNFLLGFLVVFRTSQAYVRFWEGATAIHRMRAEWFDAAAACFSFCKHSNEYAGIATFQNTLVRLFSMLHAVALAEIEDCNSEKVEDIHAFRYELVDIAGIDQQSLRAVRLSETKVELVHQWIQQLIIENISTKVLSIPPPILSRVFQEVANGMVAFHEAIKISSIPFPFPYAQSCDFLLIIHTMLVPIITSQWVTTPWWAGIFAFVQVLIFWALNLIAVEMENPFGDDENDMDMRSMQHEMNQFLLLLLSPEAQRTPTLTNKAVVVAPDEEFGGRSYSLMRERVETFMEIWETIERNENVVVANRTESTRARDSKHSNTTTNFSINRSLRTRTMGANAFAAISISPSSRSYGMQPSDGDDYELREYTDPIVASDERLSNASSQDRISLGSAHVRFSPRQSVTIYENTALSQSDLSQGDEHGDAVTIGMPIVAHEAAPLRGMPLSGLTLSQRQEVTRDGPRASPQIVPSALRVGGNLAFAQRSGEKQWI